MVKRHINYQLTIFNLCADKGINVIKKIRNNYSLRCGERKEFKCTPSFTSVTLEKLRLRTNSILIIFSVPFRLNKQSKEKIKSSPQKFSVVSYRSEEFNSSTSRDRLVLHSYICTYSTYSHRCIYIYVHACIYTACVRIKISRRVSLALDCCTGARFQDLFPLCVLPMSLFCLDNGSRRLPASEKLKYIAKITSLLVLNAA